RHSRWAVSPLARHHGWATVVARDAGGPPTSMPPPEFTKSGRSLADKEGGCPQPEFNLHIVVRLGTAPRPSVTTRGVSGTWATRPRHDGSRRIGPFPDPPTSGTSVTLTGRDAHLAEAAMHAVLIWPADTDG